MMERLFAVQHQRETFLLLCIGGLGLGMVLDVVRLLPRLGRAAAVLGDVLAALLLLALLVFASLRAGEGVRLYGLLGVALGAAAYLSAVSLVKKLSARVTAGRKSS